mmetsp:Transcript_51123/g.94618  ORF Transcript_51123/g.94618 Transcript_51123/m.94618 type:complete len:599 (-) Transcript_51123:194-1990(-)
MVIMSNRPLGSPLMAAPLARRSSGQTPQLSPRVVPNAPGWEPRKQIPSTSHRSSQAAVADALPQEKRRVSCDLGHSAPSLKDLENFRRMQESFRAELQDMRARVKELAILPQDIEKLREQMGTMQEKVWAVAKKDMEGLQDRVSKMHAEDIKAMQDIATLREKADEMQEQVSRVQARCLDIERLRSEVAKMRAEAEQSQHEHHLVDIRAEIQFLKDVDKRRFDELKDVRKSSTMMQRDFTALKAKVDKIEEDVAGLAKDGARGGHEVASSGLFAQPVKKSPKSRPAEGESHRKDHERLEAGKTKHEADVREKEVEGGGTFMRQGTTPSPASKSTAEQAADQTANEGASLTGPLQSQPGSEKEPGEPDVSSVSGRKQHTKVKAVRPADCAGIHALLQVGATGLTSSASRREGTLSSSLDSIYELESKNAAARGDPADIAQGWQSSDVAPNRRRSVSQPGHAPKAHTRAQAPGVEAVRETVAKEAASSTSGGRPADFTRGDESQASGTARKRASSQPTAGQPIFRYPPHPDDAVSRALTVKLERLIVMKKGENCSVDDKRRYIKKLMLQAHPDHGGTNEAIMWLRKFIKEKENWYYGTVQ